MRKREKTPSEVLEDDRLFCNSCGQYTKLIWSGYVTRCRVCGSYNTRIVEGGTDDRS